MAKESGRDRSLRNFGSSGCLADVVLVDRWAEVRGGPASPEESARIQEQRSTVLAACASRVFDFTSVCDRCREVRPKGWGWKEAVLGATPPHALCFLEARIPPRGSSEVSAVGWALQSFRRGEEPDVAYEATIAAKDPGAYSRCERFVVGIMAMRLRTRPAMAPEGTLCPALTMVLMLDVRGDLVSAPLFDVARPMDEAGQREVMTTWGSATLLPAMVSLRLINRGECRLVEHRVDPDVERSRRKYGLRSLVRFATIAAGPSALDYIVLAS